MSKNFKTIIPYLLIGLLLYFVFLLRLSAFHLRTWDESIYAVNAYEMAHGSSWLTPTNDWKIDHNHEKPPFAIWIEALSIKLLGCNELAVRLPSALASIISCLLMFFFVKKHFNEIFAWSTFLVLITSLGFAHFHTSRTGDTDAILTLMLLLSNIFLFKHVILEEKKNLNLILYFLFLSLAFLTKSFAALLFLPAHFLFLLLNKKIFSTLKVKGLYLGTAIFLVITLGYFYLRQKEDPYYIKNIISTDLSRVGSSIDNHLQPFDFYFNNFIEYRFSFWTILFVCGIFLLIKQKNSMPYLTELSKWVFPLITAFFLVISISNTKLEWYDMPLYPYMAIVTGYAISSLINFVASDKKNTVYLMVLIFLIPIYFAIRQSEKNDMTNGEREDERLSDYLYNRGKEGYDLNNYFIVDTAFNGPKLFYKYKLEEKGQIISLIKPSEIRTGIKIVFNDLMIKKDILEKYNYTVIDTFYEVKAVQINDLKQLQNP